MGFSTKQLMLTVASLGAMALDGLGYGKGRSHTKTGWEIHQPHPIPRMKSRGQGRKPNPSRKHRRH